MLRIFRPTSDGALCLLWISRLDSTVKGAWYFLTIPVLALAAWAELSISGCLMCAQDPVLKILGPNFVFGACSGALARTEHQLEFCAC